eukprot:COSAG02_NODE_63673_length_262_cov_1.257669_2_plen_58_part_01
MVTMKSMLTNGFCTSWEGMLSRTGSAWSANIMVSGKKHHPSCTRLLGRTKLHGTRHIK